MSLKIRLYTLNLINLKEKLVIHNGQSLNLLFQKSENEITTCMSTIAQTYPGMHFSK